MLQFTTTACTAPARVNKRVLWRFTSLFTTNPTVVVSDPPSESNKESNVTIKEKQQSNRIVTDSLRHQLMTENVREMAESNDIASKIKTIKTLEELLDLVLLPKLTSKEALKIMSTITVWANSGEVNIENIKDDQRFVTLQKKLGGQRSKVDYETVKSKHITDLYSNLSVPAMIRVISHLAETKTRAIPHLRFLTKNIVEYSTILSAGQCASLSYSLAVLSFADENLLMKISNDIITKHINVKHRTLASILTSMGILKYKNEDLLDMVSDIILTSSHDFSLSNLMPILKTFATLGFATHKVTLIIQKFIFPLPKDAMPVDQWIDLVWSLIVLDTVNNSHVELVLDRKDDRGAGLKSVQKMKLANINGAARYLLKNYEGNYLACDSEIVQTVSLRSEQKALYLEALATTLQALLQSPSLFKTDVNTELGFSIDAICCLDSNYTTIPVSKENLNSSDTIRIAMLLNDYNDYCRGKKDPLGMIQLRVKLLEAQGYHTVMISYDNFGLEDKIIKRVNYLKQCIQSIQARLTT